MERIGTDSQGKFLVYFDTYTNTFDITEKRGNKKTKIQLNRDGTKILEDENVRITIPISLDDIHIINKNK